MFAMSWKKLVLFLAAVAMTAWVRPDSPTGRPLADSREQLLDYVMVEVNGTPRLLRPGGEYLIVRGDRFVVKEATLVGGGPIEQVNVLGFHQRGSRPGEDRGIEVRTEELRPRWSEGGKGEVYAIVATSGDVLHGAVYLRLIDPVLRFAEISVNGSRRVLRDGESLSAKAADLVKVEKIVTNLDNLGDVIFQIVPAESGASDTASAERYEIRFLRRGAVFARVPLSLERG